MVNTFSEALHKLLDAIKAAGHPVSPWQEYRDSILWEINASDVLDANAVNLAKVHKKLTANDKNHGVWAR